MSVLSELRIALRTLRSTPGFTVAATLSLALGIGGAVAMLAAVDAALLRPLPWPDPDRLVSIRGREPGGAPVRVSLADVRDWEESIDGLRGIGGYRPRSFAVRGAAAGEPRVVDVGMVTAGLLPALGVETVTGRGFSVGEDRRDDAVVVLTRGLARSLLGGADEAPGRQVLLNDAPYTVVGVVDDDAALPMDGRLPRAFIPLPDELYGGSRSVRALEVVGRLAPGASLESVARELRAAAARVAREHADVAAGHSVGVESLHRELRGDARRPLLLLGAAAALLLGIGTVNVAGLLLERTARRGEEIRVRRALGARTAHLLRSFLAEAAVLGVAGGGGGAVVAAVAMAALPTLLAAAGSAGLPAGVTPPSPGPGTAGAAVALGTFLALALGAVPALAFSRSRGRDDDAPAGRGTGGGTRGRRLLVVAQLAVSLVLVLSAGLLLRSLEQLLATDPGFRTTDTWRFGIGLPEARYGTEPAMIDFHRRLRAALETLPEVESAGVVAALPLGGRQFSTRLQPAGAGLPPEERSRATINVVSPGYFETLGIPVRAGRSLSDEDTPDAPRAIVVSAAFAERFPEAGAVGDVLELSWRSTLNPPGTEWRIVGVVGDVRHAGLERPPEPTVYLSTGQFPLDGGTYVLRARGGDDLARRIQEVVHSLDPQLQRIEVGTLADRVRDSVGDRDLALSVLSLFAAAALALTGLGVYGIVAAEALRRRRELAIRKALGARPLHVAGRVLRDGLALGSLGAALGWLAFLWLGGLLAHRLHGIGPGDPVTAVAAAAVLVGAAGLASLVPSIRAARAAPMRDIREG